MSSADLYSYVSTKAGCDPVRTIFVFAPSGQASTLEDVEDFAHRSGWIEQVEESGDLLLCPLAPKGWDSVDPRLPKELYLRDRNAFHAPSGKTIPGRGGVVWTWEPLIHLVGYGDGARFVGDFAVMEPSFAASLTLVDGVPSSYEAEGLGSSHWFVPEPSEGYSTLNGDVPVAVWLVGFAAGNQLALEHFSHKGNQGWEVTSTPGLDGADPRIASRAMSERISHIVRWKNSPDGTLAWRGSREEFFDGSRFEHRRVSSNGIDYHYAIHFPRGCMAEGRAGLPLVISMHGRGEPTWIFSDKNGWEDLSDETGAFAVLLPDSPQNIWSLSRDDGSIRAIVEDALDAYGLDETRVYLTGFSNGGAFTWQQATSHPRLFAAASPWNCPPESAIVGSGMGDFIFNPGFASSGCRMPFFVCYGDADDKAPLDATLLERALEADGCDSQSRVSRQGPAAYSSERGYDQAERLRTDAYSDAEGRELVCMTVVRDMPHGAIADEARAAWEFLSRWRRPVGSADVTEVEQ
nr:hypothetical protein [uncultured Olsenella sp.]